MAVVGYLLYGDNVLDEVTTNMIKTEGYAKSVKILILILVAVVPVTKFPLQLVSNLSCLLDIGLTIRQCRTNRLYARGVLTSRPSRSITKAKSLQSIEIPQPFTKSLLPHTGNCCCGHYCHCGAVLRTYFGTNGRSLWVPDLRDHAHQFSSQNVPRPAFEETDRL